MDISGERESLLSELEELLDYKFKDKKLLNLAFIHRSYVNENKDVSISNERLEFLGDVVLGFVVSVELYKQFPNEYEGFLTKVRSRVVCENSFAYAAKSFNIGRYLLLGKGEDHFGGRERESILADTFEALFGALYLDGGMSVVSRIANAHFFDRVMYKIHKDIFIKDYKSYLQEYYHKNSTSKIKYSILKESGPDHDKEFYISVSLNDEQIGYGKGKNKKQAEQNAARDALIKVGVISE